MLVLIIPEFRPYSWEEIKEEMKERKIKKRYE